MGRTYCVVPSCKYRGDGRGYFTIPKNEQFEVWVEKLDLSETVKDRQRKHLVCFRHFAPDEFKNTGKKIKLLNGKHFN